MIWLMGLGRLEYASELAVWGERQVGRQGESYFARVQLHPNAKETEANWLPAPASTRRVLQRSRDPAREGGAMVFEA